MRKKNKAEDNPKYNIGTTMRYFDIKELEVSPHNLKYRIKVDNFKGGYATIPGHRVPEGLTDKTKENYRLVVTTYHISKKVKRYMYKVELKPINSLLTNRVMDNILMWNKVFSNKGVK